MTTQTLTIIAGVVAAIGVVVTIVVAVLRPGRATARTVAIPLVAVAVAAAVATGPVSRSATHSSFFPTIHLWYLLATIALPAVGLALAGVAIWRKASWPVWLAVVVLVIPGPIGWYSTHVAPYDIGVDEVSIELSSDRAGSDPIRIGVLSDLQTSRVTSYEHEAVDLLMATEPDLIVIPGDVFQGDDAQFDAQVLALRELFGRLAAPAGVFAVRGDTDTGDRLDRIVAGTDVEILDQEVVELDIGDRHVLLGGNELLWAGLEGKAVRDELLAADPADVRIRLAHRPDVALGHPPDAPIDVTIAGHTHGGQVSLPLIGPLVTFSKVPRSVAAGGLSDLDGNPVYVSSGVGMVRMSAPQVRFGTTPSVGLVVLE